MRAITKKRTVETDVGTLATTGEKIELKNELNSKRSASNI